MNIYIPVEIKKRALESRILLALAAAERGHSVLVGSVSEIYNPVVNGILKPGIIHDKSITPVPSRIKKLRRAVELGHIITSQDEEHGLLDETYDSFAKRRYSDETLGLTSKVFCWGNHDYYSLMKIYPQHKNKFINSGSPRVDLWNNQFDDYYKNSINQPGAKFYENYGEYILIASNFGTILNVRPFWSMIDDHRRNRHIRNKEQEFSKYSSASWQFKLLASFIQLIRELSIKFPEKKIIVRPHPVEAEEAWSNLIGQFENIFIEKKGSINSWIRNAKVLIHNGCTSALESKISGTPVIAFRPIQSNFERSIPNRVSLNANSTGEVIRFIQELNEKHHTVNKNDIINSRFSNLDGCLAVDRIVEAWEKLEVDTLNELNNWKFHQFYNAKKHLKGVLKSYFHERYTSREEKYKNQKFSDLKTYEYEKIISGISQSLNRFSDLKVKRYGSKSIIIQK